MVEWYQVALCLGFVCFTPMGFGMMLLGLFLLYCVLFAWLSLMPIFKWHFRLMSKVWYFGLSIVTNQKILKFAGLGILLMIIASIFM